MSAHGLQRAPRIRSTAMTCLATSEFASAFPRSTARSIARKATPKDQGRPQARKPCQRALQMPQRGPTNEVSVALRSTVFFKARFGFVPFATTKTRKGHT